MAGVTKPQALGPGSSIAIVAPSGPAKLDRLEKGLRFLKQRGYHLKVFPQVRRRLGYLAGDDTARADALMAAFADKRISGIFCARGGYGSQRVLSHLDFDVIARNPKVIVGYSDLTAILLAIYRKCHMVTFHGPMVSVEFGKRLRPFTVRQFFRAIESESPLGRIDWPAHYRRASINRGKASGEIVGGNLSLMAKLVGTGFLSSFKGKIVFLEDTEEEPYRLDGYLSQLFMATDISEAAGFVIGEITRTEARYGHTKGWSAAEVINDYFGKLRQPIICNFPCGHGKEKITVPMGVKVEIDADRKILEFKEAGVK